MSEAQNLEMAAVAARAALPMRRNIHSKARGSSLVELILVVAVILTVTASAIPSVLRSSKVYELNYKAGYLAAVLKRTRSEAVRLNTSVTCQIQQQNTPYRVLSFREISQ